MEQEKIEPIFENISPKEMALNKIPHPIPGDFATLKDELLEKCNPKCFMQPYEHDKIEFANNIYPSIIECGYNDIDKLKEFRLQAINKLGISFATEKLYKQLCLCCDISQYSDKNNYDTEKVALANNYLKIIRDNADNIIVLEDVAQQVKSAGLWKDDVEDIKSPNDNKETDGYFITFVFFAMVLLIAFLIALNSQK